MSDNQILPRTVSKIEHCTTIPAHREQAKDYLPEALQREINILWLTIMSQHTTKWLARLFLEKRVKAKTIRVLTLDPNVDEAVIRSFARHLNEPPSEAVIQVKAAWNAWCELSRDYPRLSVRAYSSSPTLQGVFLDEGEAIIEVMSFHSGPNERVGLLVTAKNSPETFRTLASATEHMWDSGRAPAGTE